METIQKYRCETCGMQVEFEGAAPAVSDCCQGRWSAVEKLPACGMPASAEQTEVTVIDLDLSDLAGRKVHLILGMTVENNKPENANGFWFVPRIDRLAD